MVTDHNEQQKLLFNTPNPVELKQAAENDPIHEDESSYESDVIEKPDEDAGSALQLGAETGVDTSGSQIVTANLSGH